jgi:hypothetical protein
MSALSWTTENSFETDNEIINVDMGEYTVYTVFDGGYYDLVNSNYPVLNNIYDYEQDFLRTGVIDGNAYLGCYSFRTKTGLKMGIVYGCVISPESFLAYNSEIVGLYLTEYDTTTIRNEISSVELMKLYTIPNGECVVVVKTYWIRIIQRVWKRIYKENAHKNKVRRTTESLRYFEIHGRYADAAKHVYGLSGMLSFLQN